MGDIVNIKGARAAAGRRRFGDWRIQLLSFCCLASFPLGASLIFYGLYLFGLPLALVSAGIGMLLVGVYCGAQFEQRLARWQKQHGIPPG